MEVLDVQMAVHVYRQLGDAGMVMGLERIAYVEDKNLLAGHVALLFGNYQTAQARKNLWLLNPTGEVTGEQRRNKRTLDADAPAFRAGILTLSVLLKRPPLLQCIRSFSMLRHEA